MHQVSTNQGMVLQVRLQTQDPSRPRYSGTLHCLRTMVKEESVGMAERS